jgi:hypothetical protein
MAGRPDEAGTVMESESQSEISYSDGIFLRRQRHGQLLTGHAGWKTVAPVTAYSPPA